MIERLCCQSLGPIPYPSISSPAKQIYSKFLLGVPCSFCHSEPTVWRPFYVPFCWQSSAFYLCDSCLIPVAFPIRFYVGSKLVAISSWGNIYFVTYGLSVSPVNISALAVQYPTVLLLDNFIFVILWILRCSQCGKCPSGFIDSSSV